MRGPRQPTIYKYSQVVVFINNLQWYSLFVCTVVMDALYRKFYCNWLIQKVIRLSYNKFDELQDESLDEKTKLCRDIFPLYMTTPLPFD